MRYYSRIKEIPPACLPFLPPHFTRSISFPGVPSRWALAHALYGVRHTSALIFSPDARLHVSFVNAVFIVAVSSAHLLFAHNSSAYFPCNVPVLSWLHFSCASLVTYTSLVSCTALHAYVRLRFGARIFGFFPFASAFECRVNKHSQSRTSPACELGLFCPTAGEQPLTARIGRQLTYYGFTIPLRPPARLTYALIFRFIWVRGPIAIAHTHSGTLTNEHRPYPGSI